MAALGASEIFGGRRSVIGGKGSTVSIKLKERLSRKGIPEEEFTLVNESKSQSETVGYSGSAFSATRIGAHDDCVTVIGNVLLDVALQEGAGVKIVNYSM